MKGVETTATTIGTKTAAVLYRAFLGKRRIGSSIGVCLNAADDTGGDGRMRHEGTRPTDRMPCRRALRLPTDQNPCDDTATKCGVLVWDGSTPDVASRDYSSRSVWRRRARMAGLTIVALLPGFAKRWCYRSLFGYELGPDVRIGLALLDARHAS